MCLNFYQQVAHEECVRKEEGDIYSFVGSFVLVVNTSLTGTAMSFR